MKFWIGHQPEESEVAKLNIINRLRIVLCLSLLTAGCATDLEITVPEDHPANPKAVSAGKDADRHPYAYSLPSPQTGTGEAQKAPCPRANLSEEDRKGMTHSTEEKSGHPEEGG
ncbi:MAG: hypothetical protein JRL30_27925 [Deltaproteobacteria bacterium]|nr:hypothetical protein [Deltaproteobacteria bacterium]